MSESTERNSLFESIRKRNDAFEEVYPGPKHEEVSVKVHESVSDEAFKATWGMTRKEFEDQNRKAVDDLFKEPEEIGRVFEPSGGKLEEKALASDNVKSNVKSMVDTGGVFEKQDKLDEQPRFSETPNKRLGNIDWDAFYDESDTMDPNQPHLSRQPTRFEDVKVYYHDIKDTVTGVKGLDPKDIDNLKKQIDKLEVEKKDGPTMSGPSTHSSFGDLK